MTRAFVNRVLSVILLFLVGGVSFGARAAEPSSNGSSNGMIRGFRYTDCRKGQCLLVKAPKAWMSNASGGFIAEASGKEVAHVEVLKDGKSTLKKTADEAVLRPEIDLLTFENDREVVLIELSTFDVQVVKK